MVFAIIGAATFSVVIVLSILMICGAPLGELTLGGGYKVLPKKLRWLLFAQLALQIAFVIVILQQGGIMPLWFPTLATKILCIVMAAYLTINTYCNAFSRSKKERYIMTPLSLTATICFWVVALTH